MEFKLRLDGEKYYLRPWENENSERLQSWYYSGDYPFFFRNFSQSLERQMFEHCGPLMGGTVYSVFSRETKDIIGIVGIVDYRSVPRTAKLMALIDKEHQGSGAMLESFQLLHEYCFKKLDLRRIMIDVAETDKRSNALCEKAGYVAAGTVDLCVVDGLVQDEVRWSMDRELYFKIYGGV